MQRQPCLSHTWVISASDSCTALGGILVCELLPVINGCCNDCWWGLRNSTRVCSMADSIASLIVQLPMGPLDPGWGRGLVWPPYYFLQGKRSHHLLCLPLQFSPPVIHVWTNPAWKHSYSSRWDYPVIFSVPFSSLTFCFLFHSTLFKKVNSFLAGKGIQFPTLWIIMLFFPESSAHNRNNICGLLHWLIGWPMTIMYYKAKNEFSMPRFISITIKTRFHSWFVVASGCSPSSKNHLKL